MADYDRAELERLQAEAAARIREMHARAQPAPSEPAPARRQPADDGLLPVPSFVRMPPGWTDGRQAERLAERQEGRQAERQDRQEGGQTYRRTERQENPHGPRPDGRQTGRQEERGERRFEPMPTPAEEPSRRGPTPFRRPAGNEGRGRGSAEPRLPARRQEPPSQASRGTGMDLMKLLNFKNIDLDGDRTLILLIILLLSGEENDQFLTMALLYLLV